MADHPRLTIHHFTRRPPMDLNVFLAVTRRRHTSLASLHAHTQDAESRRRPEQGPSETPPKRKRKDSDNHTRREEARAKRRKERDVIKQQRIQALETRLREIQKEKEQLEAEENEIIEKKDALFVKKQVLADNRRKVRLTLCSVVLHSILCLTDDGLHPPFTLFVAYTAAADERLITKA